MFGIFAAGLQMAIKLKTNKQGLCMVRGEGEAAARAVTDAHKSWHWRSIFSFSTAVIKIWPPLGLTADCRQK